MLVGLIGYKGSGKSVVARHLTLNHCYVRRPFAYHLKAMLGALGVPAGYLDGNDALKSKPLEVLGGHSTRHAMQTLGTEWGRTYLGGDFWVDRWKAGISDYRQVVVDDVRFGNEGKAIRDCGGLLIRITRPGVGGSSHVSEALDGLSFDAEVINDGSESDLCCAVDRVLFPTDVLMAGARAL